MQPYRDAEVCRVLLQGGVQRNVGAATNGMTVLSSFDIFAQAGGANIAVDRPSAMNTISGTITIRFSRGTAGEPTVDPIQIQ